MAFTISNNSPSPGYIAWSGLHIQFSGETYIIADGNTDKVYAYWTPAYPNNLVVSPTRARPGLLSHNLPTAFTLLS